MNYDKFTNDELKKEISKIEVRMAIAYSDYFHDKKHFDTDDICESIFNVFSYSNIIYNLWEEIKKRGEKC